MSRKTPKDRLDALLCEIEEFERHEDIPRVLVAIEAAFEACGTFSDEQRLVGTLVAMADNYYFAFAKVVERLWLHAQRWEGSEKGRTLAAIAWYLAPALRKWTAPLPAEQIRTELEAAPSSEVQTLLVERQSELWHLASSDNVDVAMGAIMVLGTVQSLDEGDLELLLEASTELAHPLPLATGLLAIGRAGQYCRASYGQDVLTPLTPLVGDLVEHPNTWVKTLAVGTLALLGLPLPASATDVLVAAIEERAPIPPCWVPSGAFWKDDTSLQFACTIVGFAGLARSEQLERALRAVPEGADRRDALVALGRLGSSC